ncbi:hypothetical protein BH753_gp014 [Bacillus phage Shbh1]|uniref:Uncharacterized protein n=1 Tax=Bacillus phage Shbh1 TaxID=1796992 RepID=A0A142F139_9CAUD|nr:hypothetical protein BH753_gp014 [Bacillus phage Shbh1]AMQ66496.1 hypothetical protein [Bacillus phage Shbh1]
MKLSFIRLQKSSFEYVQPVGFKLEEIYETSTDQDVKEMLDTLADEFHYIIEDLYNEIEEDVADSYGFLSVDEYELKELKDEIKYLKSEVEDLQKENNKLREEKAEIEKRSEYS